MMAAGIGGCSLIDKVPAKPYISPTLSHPMIGPRKVYVNRDRANDKSKAFYFAL